MSDAPGDEHADSALSASQAALRLLLELAALVCWALVGWEVGSGVWRIALAVVFPAAAAGVWGTFRVPGDRSASGRAPVPVPGVVRLFIELDVLVIPSILVVVLDRWPALGAALLLGVGIHYAATWRRVIWLVRQGPTAATTRNG